MLCTQMLFYFNGFNGLLWTCRTYWPAALWSDETPIKGVEGKGCVEELGYWGLLDALNDKCVAGRRVGQRDNGAYSRGRARTKLHLWPLVHIFC